jgi:transposase
MGAYPHALLGLEDVTHIRERAYRTRRHGKRAGQKRRRANRHAYIACKAARMDRMAVKVDAYQTSQACPRCGHTPGDNRPQKGLLFSCQTRRLTVT